MGMLQPFQDCGAIIREIAGRVKRILDMPAMFVWYFKEENTLRFWRLCGRIEKTRRKETAVTLQQLRYVTAVAGTISHAVQQFYISHPSLTNAIRELEQEVGLALSKTASSVVSRTLLEYLRSSRQQKDALQIR
jgi:predicted secreted hydrolase